MPIVVAGIVNGLYGARRTAHEGTTYNMHMHLARLVDVVGTVRATTKKTEKIALLAEFLRQTQGKEIELAALYLCGSLPQGKIGIGWRIIEAALVEGPPSSEPLTLIAVDQVL